MAESPLITQELFDETVLENEECFGLSPADAVSETVEQLVRLRSGPGRTNDNDDGDGAGARDDVRLSHLVLSHPSSPDGVEERSARREFVEALSYLDSRVGTDGTVSFDAAAGGGEADAAVALRMVGDRCRSPPVASDDGGGKGNGGGAYPYLVLFRGSSAIYTLMSYLGVLPPSSLASQDGDDDEGRRTVLSAAAASLASVLAGGPGDSAGCAAARAGLRDAFAPAAGRVVCLLGGLIAGEDGRRRSGEDGEENDKGERDEEEGGEEDASPASLILQLLRLSASATRGCEPAKVSFFQSGLPAGIALAPSLPRTRRGGAAVVVACLASPSSSVRAEACRLLASLCRYDDHRAQSGVGPTTSCAHDHAQEFHRAGAPGLLVGMARRALDGAGDGGEGEGEGGDADDALACALTALRVLAVNDEVVQTLVALGVLPLVSATLESGVCVSETDGGDGTPVASARRRRRLASSSLGLLRNLCGNDEVKTNLCLGSADGRTPTALPSLLRAMSSHPSSSAVQEHGCGALAAMALRRPANARAILAEEGPRRILDGMRRHPDSPAVQRQGALAVRNVASRLLRDSAAAGEENNRPRPDGGGGDGDDDEGTAVRDAFLCLGAEDVLRNVAGRHQGSVDEAYAALRDLGAKVSLVRFTADDLSNGGGGGSSSGRPMMFGERHNGSFRPVYDESAGLGGRVSEACASR